MSPRRAVTAADPRAWTIPASEPTPGRRGSFAHSWWGRAWVEALQGGTASAYGEDGRLQRGRTYARSGAVGAITVRPGTLEARVSGSRRTPYRTEVAVPELDDAAWDRLLDLVASRSGHLAALLDGDLPDALDAATAAARVPLVPSPRTFAYLCSCPDRGDPCKHAAALCYQFARLLDRHPAALLLLRGRDRGEIADALRQRDPAGRPDAQSDARIPAQPGPAAPAQGVPAREAFARARTGLPALPPLPAPPDEAGSGPVLPDGPGIEGVVDPAALELLAADAAARALRLHADAHTEAPSPELWHTPPLWHDAVRWAAADPGVLVFMRLAHATGRDPYDLALAARAWRHGGEDGLAALEEEFTPEGGQLASAEERLADVRGLGLRLRRTRNRWTVVGGDAQLRLGRDGRWYPYGKEDGRWWPCGPPSDDPATLLPG